MRKLKIYEVFVDGFSFYVRVHTKKEAKSLVLTEYDYWENVSELYESTKIVSFKVAKDIQVVLEEEGQGRTVTLLDLFYETLKTEIMTVPIELL